MRQNTVHTIIEHIVSDSDIHALQDKVSEFHTDVITRRLNQSNFSTAQKVEIIDGIIGNLETHRSK